jgi:1-acyl-sn-glycerol-3-phosphate acyltransferase
VLPFRRKRSLKRRIVFAARRAPERSRALRAAASQLDTPWARSWIARLLRAAFLRFVLEPTLDFYTRRRTRGRDKLADLHGPVILASNHISHMDTPVILAALPRRLRRRTAVAAAADYFYRNKLIAWLVSLFFNTVPIERRGGLSERATGHLDKLLDDGWSLLFYPEGTRSRSGRLGKARRGAAVLASVHGLPIVPIRVTGTRAAMPPGRFWPKRLHGKLFPTRHRVEISFGEPIAPSEDATAVIERVQHFFEARQDGEARENGDVATSGGAGASRSHGEVGVPDPNPVRRIQHRSAGGEEGADVNER